MTVRFMGPTDVLEWPVDSGQRHQRGSTIDASEEDVATLEGYGVWIEPVSEGDDQSASTPSDVPGDSAVEPVVPDEANIETVEYHDVVPDSRVTSTEPPVPLESVESPPEGSSSEDPMPSGPVVPDEANLEPVEYHDAVPDDRVTGPYPPSEESASTEEAPEQT